MRRLVTLALLALPLAACGATPEPAPVQASAAPAVPTQPARTTPEIQYLALVEGVPGIDTSAGDEALVQAGYKTCSWLLYGYPRNNVEGRVMLELGVNANTSTVVVHAATTYICPDQKQE